MISRILFLVAAAAVGLWSIRYWKRAVQLAMVLLIFEGAIRKWILPGAQELVYFAKDGVLVAAYIGYFSRTPSGRDQPTNRQAFLVALLVLTTLLGAVEIFNPNLPTVWLGLLGFKSYFLYIPLLWVLPEAFDRREELWRFLCSFALIGLPLGLLALLQFASPASSPLNTYARETSSASVATFGTSSRVRVTATFSYITGYVSFLYANALILLGLLSTIQWRIKSYLLLYAALTLTVVGMLVSGSRAPVLMFAVTFPMFWWLAVAKDRQNFEATSRVLGIVVVLGLIVTYGASDAVSAFYGRAAASTDVASRITSPFTQPFEVLAQAGAFGVGIGATHQAATALVDGAEPTSWLGGVILEGETGRVMLEVGLIGFVLVYSIRIYMILLAFRQSLVLRDRFCRMVAVAALLFFLTHLPSGIIFNVTAGLFYWFFGGLLFLAMRLDGERTSQSTRRVEASAVARRSGHLTHPATGALRQ